MEEKTIRKYAELMKELALTGLEITENGASIRLERGTVACGMPPNPAAPAIIGDGATSTLIEKSADLLMITSPMVGVFYAAAAENQPPLAVVGQTVKKGDVVCVIESMKLMNEIISEYDGVIEEICAQNQQEVDYGYILFKITPIK